MKPQDLQNAIEELSKSKDNATYHWVIGKDDVNNWAIVLGWADGFEIDEEDRYTDGTFRLCVKLAYQSRNNIMQCDYDVDWTMPYDEITREVDDVEISIYENYNADQIIYWLMQEFQKYITEDMTLVI